MFTKADSLTKKLIAGILLVFIIITGFASCGKEGKVEVSASKAGKASLSLVATKIGNVKTQGSTTYNDEGVTYKNSEDKYGYFFFDGANDTGAIYAKCSPVGKALCVSNAEPSDSVAGINVFGLIDSNGRVIAPEEYACFSKINDKYYVAYKALAVTKSDEQAVVTFDTQYSYVRSGSGKGTMYSGKWVVYNADTHAPVPGAEGDASNDSFNAAGNYLQYKTGSGDYVTCDNSGNVLGDGYKLLDEGFVKYEITEGGTIYDSNGKKLFDYNPNDYTVNSYDSGYFTGRKYVNNKAQYFLIDRTGEKVSADFDQTLTVKGDLIICDRHIYDFKGKELVDGEYSSVTVDKMTKSFYSLYKDEIYTVITSDGTVVIKGKIKDPFAPHKEDGKYYSFKTGKFTLDGYRISNFLLSVTDGDGRYDVVDLLTEKTLIEGYSSVRATTPEDGECYVVATRTESGGGFDIWQIQNSIDAVKNNLENLDNISGIALKELYQKREDIFNELEEQFKKEGLSVNINKATGEIAMDSTVVFGGDSSEITANGKKLLDRFAKIYVSVLSDSKYENLIEKFIVEGHTAPVAGSSYESGKPLSVERAENVKTYFINSEYGKDMSKISSSINAIGYSNSKPIYKPDGTVNMEASRRVSFRFVISNIG